MTPYQRLWLRQILPADPRGSRLDHLQGLIAEVTSEQEMASVQPRYVNHAGVRWFLSIEEAIADAVWWHANQGQCRSFVLSGDQWAVQADLAGHWACGPSRTAAAFSE